MSYPPPAEEPTIRLICLPRKNGEGGSCAQAPPAATSATATPATSDRRRPVGLSATGLRFQGVEILLAAQRHDRDLARPEIGQHHLHGCAVALQERDIARFRAPRRQVG